MILPARLAPGLIFGNIAMAILLAVSTCHAKQISASQQMTAQQTTGSDATPPSSEPSPAVSRQEPEQETPKQAQEHKEEEKTGTSNDRILWTMPDFLTVANAGQYPPLTVGQKFDVVARSSFDYFEYPWIAALAGISQAENSEPGYGQGFSGYAKRYGAAFGDSVIENFMTGSVVPSLLHQDPRYYQLGNGGFWHRTGYAVSRMFVTRSDSGNTQFNYSEIGGSLAAAAISNYSYHPRSDRNVPNMLSVWGTQVGLDSVTTVVKEFWPDIQRKFSRKKAPPS
jgi:hypothetical protein